jgi:cAMP-dependent protein kinase regulator/cGMP-dependent protein kinase 2
MDPLVPIYEIKPVMCFGERSLLKDLPRAGSAKCITDCQFAIVSKESYGALLKKVELKSILQMTQFLKQIPYIQNWIMREVYALRFLMKTEKFTRRGIIVAKENTTCDKIYIIKDGEFEIIKTDFSNVLYNDSVNCTAVIESDKKTMIKSKYKSRSSEVVIENKNNSL